MKAFTMKRRLQFYSHGLLQISQEREHQCGCHFFFFSYALVVNIRRRFLLKSNTSHHEANTTQILCQERELYRLHSKLKDVKTILEDIMLKEMNSHYLE